MAPRISSIGLNHQSSASDLDSVEMAYDSATIGLDQGNCIKQRILYVGRSWILVVKTDLVSMTFLRMILIDLS